MRLRDLKETVGLERREVIVPWYVPLMFDSYGTKEWIQILQLLIKLRQGGSKVGVPASVLWAVAVFEFFFKFSYPLNCIV